MYPQGSTDRGEEFIKVVSVVDEDDPVIELGTKVNFSLRVSPIHSRGFSVSILCRHDHPVTYRRPKIKR